MDITRWITNEVLEDHVDEPIEIIIKDLSKKYDIYINIIAQPKETK